MFIIEKYITAKTIAASIALIYCISTLWGIYKPLPTNISYISPTYYSNDISFFYDLTYMKNTTREVEQNIFNEINRLISEAEEYIVMDFFLFNKTYNDDGIEYIDIGGQLTNALIEKKSSNPQIKIVFITDPINNFYGVYESEYLKELKDNDIEVIISDLDHVRNSNFLYDGLYNISFRFLPVQGFRFIPNIFATSKEKTNLTGILRLLRFKANHRKVVVTEKSGLVTSGNPHNPSSFHSNIAYRIDGEGINELLLMEEAVAQAANQSLNITFELPKPIVNDKQVAIQFASEGKIKDEAIKYIKQCKEGDEINIATFYLAHKAIINELIKASQRDVTIKIILDENKDAFGLKKNGVPNKPVAKKLMNTSTNNLAIRWYQTTGEQFHTKLMIFKINDELISIGGSANFTRRNLDDFNYELDVITKSSQDHPFSQSIENYFNRIWYNEDGDFTKPYTDEEQIEFYKTLQYYIQEESGLSTF